MKLQIEPPRIIDRKKSFLTYISYFVCRTPQKEKTNILNVIKEKGKLLTMKGQLKKTDISNQSQKPLESGVIVSPKN